MPTFTFKLGDATVTLEQPADLPPPASIHVRYRPDVAADVDALVDALGGLADAHIAEGSSSAVYLPCIGGVRAEEAPDVSTYAFAFVELREFEKQPDVPRNPVLASLKKTQTEAAEAEAHAEAAA